MTAERIGSIMIKCEEAPRPIISIRGGKGTMHARIPVEIQCGLSKVGGLKGLKRGLPKKKDVKKGARMGYGISDETRVLILCLLMGQPLCVCVIKSVLEISDSRLSYHLSILSDCGLISKKQDRKFVIYTLTSTGKKVARTILKGPGR